MEEQEDDEDDEHAGGARGQGAGRASEQTIKGAARAGGTPVDLRQNECAYHP